MKKILLSKNGNLVASIILSIPIILFLNAMFGFGGMIGAGLRGVIGAMAGFGVVSLITSAIKRGEDAQDSTEETDG